METSQELKRPFWLLWVAAIAGLILGSAALAYTSEGRINLLGIWWLWAGLPLLGSLLALVLMLLPRSPLWLKPLLKRSSYWQPQTHQRWWLLQQMHLLWVVFALGILLVFLLLLLFTDLAFGWSSTLITDADQLLPLFRWISLPWQAFWPQAVPDLSLVEATRFARIENTQGNFALASRWWPFLLASLLTYNLLPRLLLMLFCRWRYRQLLAQRLEIRGQEEPENPDPTATNLKEESPAAWQTAPHLGWQLATAAASQPLALNLGQGRWQEEEALWQSWLKQAPQQLVWEVSGQQTPLAELADKINEARQAGCQQAIQVVAEPSPSKRHLASWQSFAHKHQLTWLEAHS
ncbi:DUF2868 domain-containing protein [Marinospirillum perlucidum]|uniref:DUF2868 domain-containing protein n=1 Tax=Marinospirillum perlucidum TaxID=1982602 RepID=UPI000DF3579E|nr:DUF2868 domain-containing protein [Marinospirillum perlucidum]